MPKISYVFSWNLKGQWENFNETMNFNESLKIDFKKMKNNISNILN